VLKLSAQDTEDLSVISAHMQDALIRAADMSFDVKRRQFALVASRYAWDAPGKQRRKAGLHFENVTAIKRKGFEAVGKNSILSLLAIDFEKTNDPSGHVNLTFAASKYLRLEVEYLNVALKDLGPAWAASATPQHET
jgi:hypothetical protein